MPSFAAALAPSSSLIAFDSKVVIDTDPRAGRLEVCVVIVHRAAAMCRADAGDRGAAIESIGR